MFNLGYGCQRKATIYTRFLLGSTSMFGGFSAVGYYSNEIRWSYRLGTNGKG